MKKKSLYAVGVAVGGAFVGFFTKELSTVFGAVMFVVGVSLVGFCTYNLSKEKK